MCFCVVVFVHSVCAIKDEVTEIYIIKPIFYWWLVKSLLSGWLLFLPQHFGKVVWIYKCHLPIFECIWGGGFTWRWFGHLNSTCCNQTCLNLLQLDVIWIKKPSLDGLQNLCIPHTPYISHPLCSFAPSCATVTSFTPVSHLVKHSPPDIFSVTSISS